MTLTTYSKTSTSKKGDKTTTDGRRVNLKIQRHKIPTSLGMEVLLGHVQLSEAALTTSDKLSETIPGSLEYGNPRLEYPTAAGILHQDEQRPRTSAVSKTIYHRKHSPNLGWMRTIAETL